MIVTLSLQIYRGLPANRLIQTLMRNAGVTAGMRSRQDSSVIVHSEASGNAISRHGRTDLLPGQRVSPQEAGEKVSGRPTGSAGRSIMHAGSLSGKDEHQPLPTFFAQCLPFTYGRLSEPSTLLLSRTKSRISSSNSGTPPRLQSTMIPRR